MGSATTTPLYDKIPDHCHRFIDYVGEGFSFGVACGSALYAIKGFRNSSAGGRLASAGHAALVKAPRIGGTLGTISVLFSASDSAMALARRKDDPLNSIVAGAISWGLVQMPLGARTAAVFALFGAAVRVVFEGVDWAAGRSDTRCASDPTTRTNSPGLLPPAITPSQGSSGGLSWLTRSAIAPSPSITSNKVSDRGANYLSLNYALDKNVI